MPVSRLYRYFSLITIFFLWSVKSIAQKKYDTFETAVSAIKKNIQCCSAVFPGNSSVKATIVMIFSGGEMTIVYNNGRVPVSFNLFELYKDSSAPWGIYHKAGSKTLEFKIADIESQAIRFNTAAKAKDTYDQILFLLTTCAQNYKPQLTLTIQQTIDSINALLRQSNNDRAEISLLNNHTIKVSQMPSIRYDIDISKLKNADNPSFLQVRGLGFAPYFKDGFAVGPRIIFQQGNESMVFLKFTSKDTVIPSLIYRLFIHLGDLMRRE